MLFCLGPVCICPHAVYWKGHPLWLLWHWESTCHAADLTLFECSVYMWWALTWQSDSSVRAAHKQACPLSDRKLGAAEALLVSSASSAPCPCLITQTCLMVCTTVRVWIRPAWHICCLSECVVLVCEWVCPGQMCTSLCLILSVLTNRAHVNQPASTDCCVEGRKPSVNCSGTVTDRQSPTYFTAFINTCVQVILNYTILCSIHVPLMSLFKYSLKSY